jgi:hypothetical protein
VDEQTAVQSTDIDAGIQVDAEGIASGETQVEEPGVEIGQEQITEETPTGAESEREAGERTEAERTAAEKAGTAPLPKEISKMLRELKEARPELTPHIQELSKAYFQLKSGYQTVFPTVDDARNAKATLEALGGEEGLVELQTLREDVDTYDQMISDGNPKVLDAWFDEAREGIYKLTPTVLSRIEKENPGMFDSITRPFFVKAVLQSGIVDTVNAIGEFMGEDANPYARREYSKLVGWLRGLQEEFRNGSRAPAVDPRVEQLEAEQKKLQGEKTQQRDKDINDRIGRYVYDTLQDGIRPLLKGRTLAKDAMSDLVVGIGHEIQNLLDADPAYQKNLAALKRGGDVTRVVNYMRSKIDAKRQTAITTVWNRRYGTLPPAKKAAVSGSATGATTQARTTPSSTRATQAVPVLVPQKPPLDQFDMSKDKDQLLMTRGMGYLKSGKFVTWRK